jgi:Flp pilus assembly protein TadG
LIFSERRRPGVLGKRPGRRGGALVELAVAIPFLVLVCVGVMDYGRVYFTAVAVANAARAGAEWGSIPIIGHAYENAAQESFAKLDGAEAGTMTVAASTSCKCGETTVTCGASLCAGYGEQKVYVTVTATKTVSLLLPYPGLPSSVTISRAATFRAQ